MRCSISHRLSRGELTRRGVLGVSLFLALGALAGCGSNSAVSTPSRSPSSSSSTTTIAVKGPFAVGRRTRNFVDHTRSTAAHGGVAAQPSRRLETIIEYPVKGAADPDHEVLDGEPLTGRFPVVVYVHGRGAHADDPYLHPWAAAGFVAIATTFPLTNTDTVGGPVADDLVNEPGDVSFVLSELNHLPAADRDLQAAIDTTSVGVMGTSLGAHVSLALGYDPHQRDTRVKAVVAVAGGCPGCPHDTFAPGAPPVMLIHGSADPFAPYSWSAAEYATASTPKFFLTLEGAKHIQFDEPWQHIAERATIDFFARYLRNDRDAVRRLERDTTVASTAHLQHAGS